MDLLDTISPTGENKGQCIWPIRDVSGKTVMCGEITILDGDGNHMAFCSEHRKKVEERFREIWARKKERMAAGRKKEVTPFNHMKISKLVMR